MQYDAVVVLGSRPVDVNTWQLPSHVYKSLDKAIALYAQKLTPIIIVSGNCTIDFVFLGITQPFRECDKMEDYLLANGIPQADICKETESMDGISNLYFIKRQILVPKHMKKLCFIAGKSRLKRLGFLCQRILGPDFTVTFDGIDELTNEPYMFEERNLQLQSEFLSPMQDGDDAWLSNKFYNDPFYEAARLRVLAATSAVDNKV